MSHNTPRISFNETIDNESSINDNNGTTPSTSLNSNNSNSNRGVTIRIPIPTFSNVKKWIAVLTYISACIWLFAVALPQQQQQQQQQNLKQQNERRMKRSNDNVYISTMTEGNKNKEWFAAKPASFGKPPPFFTEYDNPYLYNQLPSMSVQLQQQEEVNLQLIDIPSFLCPSFGSSSSTDSDWWRICTPPSYSSYNDDDDGEPLGLLISRGECSFEEKAKQAVFLSRRWKKKISYLVVYDNKPSRENELLQMSATNTANNNLITSLFVSHETGLSLRQAMETKSKSFDANNNCYTAPWRTVSVTLSSQDPSFTQHFHKKNHNGYRDNYDDDNDDYYYYPVRPRTDPTHILLMQMFAALSLMFALFFCIGCWTVCCFGSNGNGGLWFTISFDGNGIRFSRNNNNNGNGNNNGGGGNENRRRNRPRLLNEEEVLSFPLVPFGLPKDDCAEQEGSSGGEDFYDDDDVEIAESCKRACLPKSLIPCDTSSYTSAPASCLDTNMAGYQPDSLSYNAMCSVCLEEFHGGEMLRSLPCGHMFHTECIVPWLTERSPYCPLCKLNLSPEEEVDEEQQQDQQNEEETAADAGENSEDLDRSEEEQADETQPILPQQQDDGTTTTNNNNNWRNSVFGWFSRRGHSNNPIQRPSSPGNTSTSIDSATTAGAVINSHHSLDENTNRTLQMEVEVEMDHRLSTMRTPLLQDARSPDGSTSRV